MVMIYTYGGRKFVTNGALSPPQRKWFLGSSRKAHSSSADTESRVSRRKESGHELSALEEAALSSFPQTLPKMNPKYFASYGTSPCHLGDCQFREVTVHVPTVTAQPACKPRKSYCRIRYQNDILHSFFRYTSQQ